MDNAVDGDPFVIDNSIERDHVVADGWSGDDGNCADVDECDNGTHLCAATDANATCQNIDGSYKPTIGCNHSYRSNGCSM